LLRPVNRRVFRFPIIAIRTDAELVAWSARFWPVVARGLGFAKRQAGAGEDSLALCRNQEAEEPPVDRVSGLHRR